MVEVMSMDEFERMSPEEQEDYLRDADFTDQIKCGRCGRIIEVGGHVWKLRLRRSRPVVVEDERTGEAVVAHTGWNCDRCADIIEGVGFGYGGSEY